MSLTETLINSELCLTKAPTIPKPLPQEVLNIHKTMYQYLECFDDIHLSVAQQIPIFCEENIGQNKERK